MAINLLKKTQLNLSELKNQKSDKSNIRNLSMSSSLILFVLVLLISLSLILYYWKSINDNATLAKTQISLRKQLQDLTTSQVGYLEFSIKSSVLAKQLNSDPIQLKAYNDIRSNLETSGISYDISGMSFDNSKFNYKFLTTDFQTSAKILDSLSKSKLFTNLILVSATQNLVGKVETTITFDAAK